MCVQLTTPMKTLSCFLLRGKKQWARPGVEDSLPLEPRRRRCHTDATASPSFH